MRNSIQYLPQCIDLELKKPELMMRLTARLTISHQDFFAAIAVYLNNKRDCDV